MMVAGRHLEKGFLALKNRHIKEIGPWALECDILEHWSVSIVMPEADTAILAWKREPAEVNSNKMRMAEY